MRERFGKITEYLQVPRVGYAPGRNLDMDALKGLAILLVVLGHAITTYAYPDFYGSFGQHLHDSSSYVVTFIYAFHMPLFACVSGFVIFGKRISAWDKFLRLMVPLLSWIMVHFLIDRFVLHEAVSLFGSYKNIFLHPELRLWYLSFLFLCYLCLIPVTFLERRRNYLGEVSLALLFIAFNVIPLNILGFLDLRNYFLFFALGYLIAKHRERFERVRPYIANSVLAAAAALFLLFFLLFYDRLPHFTLFTGMSDIVAHPYQFLARYGMALLGILASYGLVKLLRGDRAYKSLCWFGLVTMDIYVAHGIMMRISFGAGWVKIISAFVAGVLFSLALSFLILRRSRILSALFLGMKWKKRKEVEGGADQM